MHGDLVEGMLPQEAVLHPAQEMPAVRTVLLPERQHVELVVSQEGDCRARIAHGSHKSHRFPDFVPAVDVIAQEDDGTFPARIPEYALRFFVTQLFQELSQFGTVSVDIAYKVNR